ncbi:MAG: hypothetical protein L0211_11730 [Planctomycetaceae bacterium]|nr:hypothetical protein [Planctomycetaceae bacterium]
MPRARGGHGPVELLDERPVGLAEIQPFLFRDQLVAELVVPRFQGGASRAISHDAAGPDDQQRIRAAGAAPLSASQVFTHRAQRRVERVAGIHRPVEVLRAEGDPLRLKDDTRLGALDVDRAAARAVGAVIGD